MNNQTKRIGRRILVTGANGFVGGHLLRMLHVNENKDIVKSVAHGTFDGQGYSADITNRSEIRNVIADFQPEIVFHLAGYASVKQSSLDAGSAWNVNLIGTFNLATAIAKYSPQATLLHVSSSEVYGKSFDLGMVTEDTALVPQSVYAKTKSAAETMLYDVFPATGKLIIARPFNHTGPGQDERFVIPDFVSQLLNAESHKLDLWVGNLDAQREFLDVRDVVRAYIMLADSAADLPRQSVFNIALGNTFRIRDILDQLISISGCNVAVHTDPERFRPNEIARAVGSSEKIRTKLDWSPLVPLEQTLRDVFEYERRKRVGVN